MQWISSVVLHFHTTNESQAVNISLVCMEKLEQRASPSPATKHYLQFWHASQVLLPSLSQHMLRWFNSLKRYLPTWTPVSQLHVRLASFEVNQPDLKRARGCESGHDTYLFLAGGPKHCMSVTLMMNWSCPFRKMKFLLTVSTWIIKVFFNSTHDNLLSARTYNVCI